MTELEVVKKVLAQYGLVTDQTLNDRLIDRVAKILCKEFEIKNKFEVDDGPIAIDGAKIVKEASTTPSAAPSANQAHFQKALSQARQSDPGKVKAAQAAAAMVAASGIDASDPVEESVSEDEVEGEGDGKIPVIPTLADSFENLNAKDRLKLEQSLPHRGLDSDRPLQGGGKTIRRVGNG